MPFSKMQTESMPISVYARPNTKHRSLLLGRQLSISRGCCPGAAGKANRFRGYRTGLLHRNVFHSTFPQPQASFDGVGAS